MDGWRIACVGIVLITLGLFSFKNRAASTARAMPFCGALRHSKEANSPDAAAVPRLTTDCSAWEPFSLGGKPPHLVDDLALDGTSGPFLCAAHPAGHPFAVDISRLAPVNPVIRGHGIPAFSDRKWALDNAGIAETRPRRRIGVTPSRVHEVSQANHTLGFRHGVCGRSLADPQSA